MKVAIVALAAFVYPLASTAHADPVADFYSGQTVTFHVGAGAGATYALYAHILADHMPRHIPGQPSMIVNMAGGQSGGVIAANYLHNAAPKNGLTIGMTQQTVIVDQVLRPQGKKFDVTKWNWIGLMAPAVGGRVDGAGVVLPESAESAGQLERLGRQEQRVARHRLEHHGVAHEFGLLPGVG